MTQQEILEVIVKALDSKRAEDIQVLRVQDLTILGDYFIIANGTSTTHTRTLADEVEYQMSEKGVEPMHREGRGNGSNWVVLDYADVIVHVFCKDAREFYQLERLWASRWIFRSGSSRTECRVAFRALKMPCRSFSEIGKKSPEAALDFLMQQFF